MAVFAGPAQPLLSLNPQEDDKFHKEVAQARRRATKVSGLRDARSVPASAASRVSQGGPTPRAWGPRREVGLAGKAWRGMQRVRGRGDGALGDGACRLHSLTGPGIRLHSHGFQLETRLELTRGRCRRREGSPWPGNVRLAGSTQGDLRAKWRRCRWRAPPGGVE